MKHLFYSMHRVIGASLMMLVLLAGGRAVAQCKPAIKIDGRINVVDPNDRFGINLPYWLKEGQTLSVGSSISAISVLEFTVAGSNLEFSQVLSIESTSPVTVPDGTAWKIESVSKDNNSSTYQMATFASAGTYTWTVPMCAEQICIELWGGGGGASGNLSASPWASGAGGGGGGFGSQCFTVTPGDTYTIIVGAGGNGGSGGNPGQNGQPGTASSVGSLITATAGSAGLYSSGGGTGGAGGTATSSIPASLSVAQGANGLNGAAGCDAMSGRGGAAGNGGAGGAGLRASQVGQSPAHGLPGQPPGGGGGGGSGNCSSAATGGSGAPGRVIITW